MSGMQRYYPETRESIGWWGGAQTGAGGQFTDLEALYNPQIFLNKVSLKVSISPQSSTGLHCRGDSPLAVPKLLCLPALFFGFGGLCACVCVLIKETFVIAVLHESKSHLFSVFM